jgi:hypothetical protein
VGRTGEPLMIHDKSIGHGIISPSTPDLGDGKAIYGDDIAVASRLERLAEPGGINLSRAVRDHSIQRQ